jgi:hypothetical protein
MLLPKAVNGKCKKEGLCYYYAWEFVTGRKEAMHIYRALEHIERVRGLDDFGGLSDIMDNGGYLVILPDQTYQPA